MRHRATYHEESQVLIVKLPYDPESLEHGKMLFGRNMEHKIRTKNINTAEENFAWHLVHTCTYVFSSHYCKRLNLVVLGFSNRFSSHPAVWCSTSHFHVISITSTHHMTLLFIPHYYSGQPWPMTPPHRHPHWLTFQSGVYVLGSSILSNGYIAR